MRYIMISASFLFLAACGGSDGMTAEERAEIDAKCAVVYKILAAREDTPAFSSLTEDDIPPGATGCVLGTDRFYPTEAFLDRSETLAVPAYVCSYETSTSTDPHAQTRIDFTALGKRVTDCVRDWDKLGVGGASEDGLSHFAGYQYSKRNDRGYPKKNGGYFAPVSYTWLLSADPEYAIEGQRVVFYVLGK